MVSAKMSSSGCCRCKQSPIPVGHQRLCMNSCSRCKQFLRLASYGFQRRGRAAAVNSSLIAVAHFTGVFTISIVSDERVIFCPHESAGVPMNLPRL